MSLLSFCHWLQNSELGTAVHESTYFYPTILTTHLACIAVFGGMILMSDLRLLGWAMQKRSVSDVVGQLRIWKRVGFVIMVTCGILLGGSEAEKYYGNPYFWTKMVLLSLVGVHAIIFRPRVYNQLAEIDRAPVLPARAKLAGGLSLILWISIASAGRMIGYYEPPKPQTQVTSLRGDSSRLSQRRPPIEPIKKDSGFGEARISATQGGTGGSLQVRI